MYVVCVCLALSLCLYVVASLTEGWCMYVIQPSVMSVNADTKKQFLADLLTGIASQVMSKFTDINV